MKDYRYQNFTKSFLVLILLFVLSGCGNGFFKRSDVKDNPVNVEDRVRKNIEEGRGVRFGIGKKKGGVFDFASSNELWRASVETLDFVPLITASYSGGIIITDWFNGGNSNNRDLKITIRFLTNEVRADGLKIIDASIPFGSVLILVFKIAISIIIVYLIHLLNWLHEFHAGAQFLYENTIISCTRD